jgi:hypothetical protein
MSKKSYIDDLKEWNNNMYSPGHYTGGRMPMDVKYGGNKARVIILIQSLLILFVGVVFLLETDHRGIGCISLSIGVFVSAVVIWRMCYKKPK